MTDTKHTEWLSDDQRTLETVGRQIGVWRYDFISDALEWSDGLLHMAGLERATFGATGQAAMALVHPDDRLLREVAIQNHLTTGTPYRSQYRLRHSDGHYIHCRTEGTAVRDPSGRPIAIAGITLDVSTEAVAIEQLRDSERRLGALAAGFDGAIFRYHMHADGTDRLSYMSEGAERVWGLKPEEVIGDASKVWASVHRNDVKSVAQAFEKCAKSQKKLNMRWRIFPIGGEMRWIECRAAPKRTAQGDTIWDGFVIDISEMMAARDELQRTTEMLGQAQKLEAIGRISGGIAHDFNNLLAVILGNAELIDKSAMVAEDRASISAIITSCEKGADLTRRLLSFARKSQLDPSHVSLRQIVTDMVPLIRRTWPENIEMNWDETAAARADILADVGLLESSILNILLNARDAMPSGGTLTISIEEIDAPTAKTDTAPVGAGRYAALRISDTGHGIPDHLLQRVTEPFVTTKGPELGSGLGLAMVDGFLAQSGGFLSIESAPDAGTVITLNIPVAHHATGDGPGMAAAAPPPSTPKGTVVKGRALLVEDEEQVRLVTARILRAMGLEVDAVANADQALDLISRSGGSFDLMLSDIVMPGDLNGRDLAVETSRRFPHMPILLMTGHGPDQVQDVAEAGTFDDLLSKPIERKVLEGAVLRLLARTPRPG